MYSLSMAPDTSPNREEVRQNPRHARSIAIALVLALLVAACSSDTATTEDSGETVTTTTAASPDTTAAAEDGDEDPVSLGLPGEVSAGDTVETPILGGLRFVVPEDRSIYQAPGLIVIEPSGLASIDLVPAVETLEGESIDSVDAVVSLIAEAPTTLDEADPTTIAGHEARVFDFVSEHRGAPRPDHAVFRIAEGAVGGWGPVGEGRAWLMDTPRGILLFSAQVFVPGEEDLAELIIEAETIFATLELVEVGS